MHYADTKHIEDNIRYYPKTNDIIFWLDSFKSVSLKSIIKETIKEVLEEMINEKN